MRILDSGEMPGEAAAGERLEEVILPDTVSVIGDYAFYGCRRLKRIGFSDTLSRIGSGAFIGCGSLDTFLFRERKTGKNSLSQMLSELRQAVTAEITGTVEGKERRSCLVFPGYYEMSVENVPARIFEVHYQGTGYRYRQCFRDGSVDYKAYDALFGLAKNQEPHQILTPAGILQDPVSGRAGRRGQNRISGLFQRLCPGSRRNPAGKRRSGGGAPDRGGGRVRRKDQKKELASAGCPGGGGASCRRRRRRFLYGVAGGDRIWDRRFQVRKREEAGRRRTERCAGCDDGAGGPTGKNRMSVLSDGLPLPQTGKEKTEQAV